MNETGFHDGNVSVAMRTAGVALLPNDSLGFEPWDGQAPRRARVIDGLGGAVAREVTVDEMKNRLAMNT